MDSILSYFSSQGVDLISCLKFAAILLVGTLLLSSVMRFIFRKQTMLGSAISSSIAIIFIYVVMVLIITAIAKLRFLVTPLPLVNISKDSIQFFSFRGAPYSVVASQLLSMIILAFLMNLLDAWIPRGKGLLRWLFLRCLTVTAGFLVHYLFTWLMNQYLPHFIFTYAPSILFALLIIMLLTGALRFIVGLILVTVNPIIAALYTFFFASFVGKQITKAVLTTGILCGIVLLLDKLGIMGLSLAPGALVAYIPFLLVLVLVWYPLSRP